MHPAGELPVATDSLRRSLRTRLFAGWGGTLATLAIFYLAWRILPGLIEWAFFEAVWSPADPQLCRELQGRGACWGFIADKYRFILFGAVFYYEYPDGIAYVGLAAIVVAGIFNVLDDRTRIRFLPHLSQGGEGPSVLRESTRPLRAIDEESAVLEAPIAGAAEATSSER